MSNARERYNSQRHKKLSVGDLVEVRDDLLGIYTTLSKTRKKLDQRGKIFAISKITGLSSGRAKRYHLQGLEGVKWERCMLIKIDREVNEI